MKDGPRPKFLETKVAYYLTGPSEQWKRSDSLEAIGAERRTFYLGGPAGDAFHSGLLIATKPAGPAEPDHFVYDPRDLRPGQQPEDENSQPLTDQRSALELFGGVVYHSEPFAEETEVSGQVKLSLWMALDVPDTDFMVSLYEILPSGGSVQLTADLLRARYRDSLDKEWPRARVRGLASIPAGGFTAGRAIR